MLVEGATSSTMTTQAMEDEVQADGRVTLEGLRCRRGQKFNRVLFAEEEESTPPCTPEQVKAKREPMRATAKRCAETFEPACDPSE